MAKKIVLSVDLMGGSKAPLAVIKALEVVSARHHDLYFLLFGDETRVRGLLDASELDKSNYTFYHCPYAISDDEQPIKALKAGANSSMRKAIDAVKNREADACISSGNTGALMVMAKMVLGSLPQIKRPAIVSVFPNRKSGSVMLDLGANAECDPFNLYQFAVMGECFAKVITKRSHPSIGILNVGVEEYKGRELDKKAAELLKSSQLNYYGFIEGHDIAEGTVDIIVTDGFSGNIALKVAEGTAKTCLDYMKRGLTSGVLAKVGGILAKTSLRTAFDSIDPRNYNGAMFIGVDGIVVKSHGSSDEIGFANALEVSIKLVRNRINHLISEMVEEHEAIKEGSSLLTKIKKTLKID